MNYCIPLLLIITLMLFPAPAGPEEVHPQPEIEGMVFVKGGCFEMGDTIGDGDSIEIPVHRVCIDDYFIGRHEVTQREWTQVMGHNPSYFIKCDDCPVDNVRYIDVKKFIARLNMKSPVTYRLPTEAEWEYAARSRGKKENWSGTSNRENLDDYAWHKDNSGRRTHPVGQKMPNELGIHDMSGNVQEWVSDFFANDYYKTSPKKNPQGPAGSQYRGVRGGSWLNSAWGIRSSIRYRFTQDDGGWEFGFRLAASPAI